MNKFTFSDLFVVAHETQVHPVRAKLEFVRGLVRVVALGAISFFNRLVNSFLRINAVMTFVAELSDLSDRREFVFTFLHVTGCAITHRCRAMDKLFLPHFTMTFISDTGLSLLGMNNMPVRYIKGNNKNK